jgi:DNA invertase Pin-like site-specific DNA recombinase
MSKTAAYIRVSTAGQNETGQRAEITRWLQGNGIDPKHVQWFVDKKSGDDLNRPEFDKLQRAVFMGEVSTIVTYKLDRISRTMRDGINALTDWCKRSIRVVAVTEGVDFNGTVGQIVAAVLFGVAQMEQQNRRERQAAGIAVAVAEGKYKGRKLGSTKVKGGLKRALELRRKGSSVTEIARALGVSRNTIFVWFRNARKGGGKTAV